MGTSITEERHLYASLNNCAFVSTEQVCFDERPKVRARAACDECSAPYELVEVASATRTFFEVGLEQVRRARARSCGDISSDARTRAVRHRGAPACHRAAELGIPRDRACGQRCREYREVGTRHSDVIVWGADLVSHLEGCIPQRIEEALDERAERRRRAVR